MENILTNTINNKEVMTEELFKNAIGSIIKSKSRTAGEAGVMSIVKARTGNRNTLSKELLAKLNNPQKIQIAYTEDSVIIGEKLPSNDSSFNVKISGAKGMVYSAGLAREISELFELDFSDRTSITFNEVEYVLNEEYPVAVIKIK
ncbi:amidophosphoribosyltransferase [Clostridium weizhouense]|uniref:Amidophosphoribosyltransferase n=1 Tax=Clostridium weizhouense TaxID=2859781 RepID=A0ABS7ARP0_9CLOT|nr:amidophosphoribosyltransferase [Clostridium weizhouense]MBW6411339.1 amidophosphoribosyltransferase [Clostridium weizhouense]